MSIEAEILNATMKQDFRMLNIHGFVLSLKVFTGKRVTVLLLKVNCVFDVFSKQMFY